MSMIPASQVPTDPNAGLQSVDQPVRVPQPDPQAVRPLQLDHSGDEIPPVLKVPYQTPTVVDLPAHGDVVNTSGSAHGTTEWNDGVLTYTPLPGFVGNDTLNVFGLNDGSKTFTIEVDEPTDDERRSADTALDERIEKDRSAAAEDAAGPFSAEQWLYLKAWVRRELHLKASGNTEPEREILNP